MLYSTYIPINIQGFSKIRAVASDRGLCDIIFPFQNNFHQDINTPHASNVTEIFQNLEHQLDLYLKGVLTAFTIPLDIIGTAYQKKIWGILQTIPYGKALSYKEIAYHEGSAPRAVGGANKKNRLPIIIPCHRVINHDGSLGGYFGKTQTDEGSHIDLKKFFLRTEGYAC